jgi:hypothetical protein
MAAPVRTKSGQACAALLIFKDLQERMAVRSKTKLCCIWIGVDSADISQCRRDG